MVSFKFFATRDFCCYLSEDKKRAIEVGYQIKQALEAKMVDQTGTFSDG
jgi:hypothetical protein